MYSQNRVVHSFTRFKARERLVYWINLGGGEEEPNEIKDTSKSRNGIKADQTPMQQHIWQNILIFPNCQSLSELNKGS